MKWFLHVTLLSCILYANEDILSEKLKENINLKKQQTQKQSDILSVGWINPLHVNISKVKNKINSIMGEEEYFNGKLSLNQDIFRSGGIFYAIKYADVAKELGIAKIKNKKNSLIVDTYKLLLQILKNDLLQTQQKLSLENINIEIKQKKEQYLAGLTDISSLNNALISKTTQENVLLGLEDTKETLLNSFKKLSDKDYKSIKIPHVKTPSKDEYLRYNLELSINKNNIKAKKLYTKVTRSKYLPRISLNASYDITDMTTSRFSGNDKSYGYGLSLSIPLDIKMNDDIEKSKIEHLIAKNEYEISQQNQIRKYEKITNDLKRIDKKIELAKENIQIYDSLLAQTKELVDADMSIPDDLKIMKNSKKTRILQMDIYEIEREEKKMEFYTNFLNPISK